MGAFSLGVAGLKCSLHTFFLNLLIYQNICETPANSIARKRCNGLKCGILQGQSNIFLKKQEIGDINIEKLGCQIKILHDTISYYSP
jgi:hypothetical protein